MWKKLQYRIRDYFAFTQSEARGIMWLIPFMALWLAVPYAWQSWIAPVMDTSVSDRATLDSLVAELEIRQPARKPRPGFNPPAIVAPHFFAFDPNGITAQQWQQLGLRSYLADRIVNYRSKGGKFRVKKDLLKIFGFPADQYARLESYILLPDTLARNGGFGQSTKEFGKKFPEKYLPATAREDFRPRPFDLNNVDTTQLEKIRGIGPALSKRILKYRDRLGGFVTLAQLREVYGLDSVVVKEVLQYASLRDPATVKRLNVNTATVEELKQHPYISPRLAAIIVAYRQQHGPFTDAQSLAKIKILDAATLQKIGPYLAY